MVGEERDVGWTGSFRAFAQRGAELGGTSQLGDLLHTVYGGLWIL
jgi:hypothetical protein